MTCEIAIMNLQAVALAADSAMTVSRWVGSKRQVRYFEGSNKIFQLSDRHPVGIMVFDSANLQDVPWELIIKEFRRHLGSTEFGTLNEYAQHLFDFIRTDPLCFPAARRAGRFIEEDAQAAVLFVMQRLREALQLTEAPASEDDKKLTIDTYLAQQITTAESTPLPPIFGAGADTAAIERHLPAIEAQAGSTIAWAQKEGFIHADRTVDPAALAKLGVLTLFREYAAVMGCTGVVLAGYGRDDLYPALCEFNCFGVLLDQFVYTAQGEQAITPDRPAVIKPFATTSMVNTFLLGFNEEVYNTVAAEFEKSANSLGEIIKKELKVADIPSFEKHVKDHTTEYQAAWSSKVSGAHFRPINHVVSSLPINEMAELAETLIMLESLKEKVTAPTESVGGPIDVAVISRHEGFIWIKRKLYFDPAKNPRYFARQRQFSPDR
jgi:hypothetical protein